MIHLLLKYIYKAKLKGSNEYRAIKIFDTIRIINKFKKKYYRDPTNEELKPYTTSFHNEAEYMKIIQGKYKDNDYTVLFHEIYERGNEFAIVMELCDDNLFSFFTRNKNPFTPKEIFDILIQLNKSFKIMNENNIVHRDINLNNILIKYINKEKTKFICKLKLTNDSGKLGDMSENNKSYKLNSDINFMAPELLKRNNYNEKCDLWSLGTLIYVLSFRKNPFAGDNILEVLEKINKEKKLEETNDEDLNDLIKKLLVEDQIKRLNWNEYFNHRFFKRSNTIGNNKDSLLTI